MSTDSRGSLWEALRRTIPRQSVRSFVRCVRSGGRAVVSNRSLGALWKAFRRAIPPLRRSIPRQSVRCVGTVRPPGVPDPRSGQNGSIDRRSFARSFVRLARAPYARAHRPPSSTVRCLTANGGAPNANANANAEANGQNGSKWEGGGSVSGPRWADGPAIRIGQACRACSSCSVRVDVRAARRAVACARPSPAASERSEFASFPSVSCSPVPSCVLSCVLTREGPSGWGNDGKCLYLGCWECVRSCVRSCCASVRACVRIPNPPVGGVEA